MASKTGGTKILNHCERCKYFHIEVRQGGGWLEICEVTGRRVIWGDEVIELLDVDRFKAFYRLYQDNVYGGRPMPKSDKVIMAAICKMALDIKTISEGTKKRAAEWLEANNFTKGIWR